MESETEREKNTINSLSAERLEEYKEAMLSKHSELYGRFFTEPLIYEILHDESLEHSDKKVVNSKLTAVINMFISLIYGESQSADPSLNLVRTNYTFCSKKLQVSADLEALMQVIEMIDLKQNPELFRQSASAKEVKSLYKNLVNLKFPKLSVDANGCPEEKEKRSKEVIKIITYNFKEFELETISSVYKVVLKTKNPFFPPKYINLYIKVGKLAEKKEKILICKFLLMFIVSPGKIELLEVVCSFLYLLITRKDSALRFKNIAVVFAPIFFIDDESSIVDATFKETMERLKDFLEFFLENSPEIFLL
ncbi:hypothetical protein NEMIN01_1652 [Nematocida minor]|uniref:uncharacterized protein n=1 Tax=Nematocida minor TaxID=1912983 RepID=UPI00221E42DE|nr:uncharacterized protein NEMIN01_1652 [Nematocida minor]KAI5191761.1 hypothetical protein NEMIN01_1652 [Nematocida minor]